MRNRLYSCNTPFLLALIPNNFNNFMYECVNKISEVIEKCKRDKKTFVCYTSFLRDVRGHYTSLPYRVMQSEVDDSEDYARYEISVNLEHYHGYVDMSSNKLELIKLSDIFYEYDGLYYNEYDFIDILYDRMVYDKLLEIVDKSRKFNIYYIVDGVNRVVSDKSLSYIPNMVADNVCEYGGVSYDTLLKLNYHNGMRIQYND